MPHRIWGRTPRRAICRPALLALLLATPAACGVPDLASESQGASASLANVGHETGDLVFIEEIQKADYCASSASCPCAAGKR
jgi:chitinase